MDTWDDKQTGQKRTRLRVVAENMQLLGGRPPGGAGDATGESRQTSAPPKSSSTTEPDEDEIPF
jgi:single-strand DNA-binding protein